MVTVGQEFRNYKELCKFLKEGVKGGRSKELQLKRWQQSFEYHKEGQKIVVDKVKENRVRKGDGRGGNRRHVEVFLPYVIYCLVTSGIEDEYVSTQRMMKSELKLISSEVYRMFNVKDRDYTADLARAGVTSYRSFTTFVHYFEAYASETVKRCLNELQRGGGITWSIGQIFIVEGSGHASVYTIGYEEVISDIETKVCDEMNNELKCKDLKGRQLLHVIKRDERLTREFYSRCVKILREDERLIAGIKKMYEKKYRQEFRPEMLLSYYSVYYIGNVNIEKLKRWEISGMEGIRLRKAFGNPVGQELQTLKKNVYEDVFHRMESKSKKTNNKFGIIDEDFNKLKSLIAKTDYSPKKNKKQGYNNIRLRKDKFFRNDTPE